MKNWLLKHKKLILALVLLCVISWQFLQSVFPILRITHNDPSFGIQCVTWLEWLLICYLLRDVKWIEKSCLLSILLVLITGGLSLMLTYASDSLERNIGYQYYNCQLGYVISKIKGHGMSTKGAYISDKISIRQNNSVSQYKVVDKKSIKRLALAIP